MSSSGIINHSITDVQRLTITSLGVFSSMLCFSIEPYERKVWNHITAGMTDIINSGLYP